MSKPLLRVCLAIFFGCLLVLLGCGGVLGLHGFRALQALQRGDLLQTSQELGDTEFVWQVLDVVSLQQRHAFFSTLTRTAKLAQAFARTEGKGVRTYLILLQNDQELRSTGGFLGSYAKLTLHDGQYQDLQVQDIYVPDGQLQGYVQPPWPLQQYLFQTGGWKLRDANWDPHFPAAAQAVSWFFVQAGEPAPDGVIAITFSYVQSLWAMLGKVFVPDVNRPVSADELYLYTQRGVEHKFFPGSTQKKDTLAGLTRAGKRQLTELSWPQKLQLIWHAVQGLDQKDVQLWFKEPMLQVQVEQAGWSGEITNVQSTQQNVFSDYLYLVEANLGINKTNCCVQRLVEYDVQLRPETSTAQVQLQYYNANPPVPQPPLTYGGGYLNYLRVFRGENWQFLSGDADASGSAHAQFAVADFPDLHVRQTGGLLRIEGGQSKTYVWRYNSPTSTNFSVPWTYKLNIQKQSGVRTNEYLLKVSFPESTRLIWSSVSGKLEKGLWTTQVSVLQDQKIELRFNPS